MCKYVYIFFFLQCYYNSWKTINENTKYSLLHTICHASKKVKTKTCWTPRKIKWKLFSRFLNMEKDKSAQVENHHQMFFHLSAFVYLHIYYNKTQSFVNFVNFRVCYCVSFFNIDKTKARMWKVTIWCSFHLIVFTSL